MDDSVNTCDKVIKSHEEEVKTILANFNEKNKKLAKHNVFTFTYLFINCHCIINSWFYLLLFGEISRKTKTFITIL